MTTTKEAKAREARANEIVKKIKPVDTSKVVLMEKKADKKGLQTSRKSKLGFILFLFSIIHVI